MAKTNNPLGDLWGELRKLPNKIFDLLRAVWLGITAIGKVILNAFGFFYISLWWLYCHLRLWLDPKIGKFFLTAAVIDFGMLILLHVPELDRRIDENGGKDSARHMGHLHAIGHRLVTWLSQRLGTAVAYISGYRWGKSAVEFWTLHGSDIFIAVSVVSLGLSVLMFWHHHKATERDERYRSLFPELIEMARSAALIDNADGKSRGECIENTLGVLTEIAHLRVGGEAGLKVKRASTVLKGEANQDVFTILYKWPLDAYANVKVGETIRATAAQKALQKPTRVVDSTPELAYTKGIISVPWTAVRHGIRHWHDIRGGKWRVEYVPCAFLHQAQRGEPRLLSLICTQVPGKDRGYVLCLDSKWPMSFNRVDFDMLLLAANVLGPLLQVGEPARKMVESAPKTV